MCKVISLANQKGGVSKTTSTVNLGIGLARKGKKVLLVDCDGQGSLTASLGFGEPDNMEITLPTILEKVGKDEAIDRTEGILEHEEGVSLVPCNIELSAFEVKMTTMLRREFILREYINMHKPFFDYILIDCQPSLGLITINALAASDAVIIPVLCEYLPVKGLEQLIKSIVMVRNYLNPDLFISGILPSMYDRRTKFSREIMELLDQTYGGKIHIFEAKIPKSIKVAECSAEGVSIFKHDPKGKAAVAYENLTKEVLADE